MRMKSIYVILVLLLIGGCSYGVVTMNASNKQIQKESEEVRISRNVLEAENIELNKKIERLESRKPYLSEVVEKKEEVRTTEETPKNEKLEKINSEFVSVAFNFKDSSDRSANMKAYMTEEMKNKYTENETTSKASELESVTISGKLKEYKAYTAEARNGIIKVMNDVKVTYESGSEKTEQRMMFSVTYDEETLKVQDNQFIPVINTDE